MTNFYVPVLALALVGGSAYGQHLPQGGSATLAKKFIETSVHTSARPTPAASNRAVIWSDDFSDPGTWVIGQEAGASADAWVIGTDAPSGAFAIDPIESTTADNGFALFDSDLLCSGNQIAYVQMADPVDLSGYAGVVLQFEQLFRRFRGDCFVDVSVDGSNWTEFEVNAEVDVNASTPNPDVALVNLSAIAGGQSTVWVRFRYFSTVAEHGPGGGCDYAWMVDDVAFTTLPDNEIQMDYGFVSTTGTGEEYGRIPQQQLPGFLNVGAGLFNFGSETQTNVVLTTSFTGPTAIPDLVTEVGSIESQVVVDTDDNVGIGSLDLGEYTVNYTMTSDQIGLDENPDNNTQVRNFEVTSTMYSLDKIGDHAAGVVENLQQVGTASFTDNATDVKLLTMYFVNVEMTVYGFEVGIGPASRAGGTISISLLDTTDVLSTPSIVNLPIDGVESDPYVLTAADVTAGVVTIPLPQSVTLAPGAYYACVTLGGSGTTAATDPEVFVLDDLTVPQPGLASALWLPVDFNEDGTEGPHFYGGNGTAWAIRLSSNSTIGVREEEELAGVSLFPNPTKGLVTINLANDGRHTVEVINALGEVVLTNVINRTTTLDLSGLAAGVYNARISNGVQSSIQRVVLN